MGLFGKRTMARIKLGNTFLGDSISATAEGVVLYKEYDAGERKDYYWEEWELRGFNNYDSWIEYDHYKDTTTLYEPLRPKQFLDASKLIVNQQVRFETHRGEVIDATVTEVGVGTVASREGTLTYHVFKGDTVAYAECRGRNGVYCIETYNDKEFDIYKATLLTKEMQQRLLGRAVQPSSLRKIPASTALLLIGILSFFSFSAYSSAKSNNECTPRTTSSIRMQLASPAVMNFGQLQNTTNNNAIPLNQIPPSTPSQIPTQSQQNSCTNRSVYGGGGSGYGK